MNQEQTSQPLVRVLEETEDYHYKDLFRVIRARLQYRRANGELTEPVTRLNFARGDSVGVLLYDPDPGTVLLVRQFRYPVYNVLPAEQAAQSWLLEVVAGVQEPDATAEETARREVEEEAGYGLERLERITTFYPSPGGTSERVTLFYAEVDQDRRSGHGGGLAAEGEDTELVRLSRHEALALLSRGEIVDGKTVIALQWLAQRR